METRTVLNILYIAGFIHSRTQQRTLQHAGYQQLTVRNQPEKKQELYQFYTIHRLIQGITTPLNMNNQGSDTRVHTPKNPVGFFGWTNFKKPANKTHPKTHLNWSLILFFVPLIKKHFIVLNALGQGSANFLESRAGWAPKELAVGRTGKFYVKNLITVD